MAGGRIDVEIAPDFRLFPSRLESGLKSASGVAGTIGRGLGLAVAGGAAAAAVGLSKTLQIGIEYTNQLNTLQSVTQATGVQMAQVGTLAKQLGADMSLPATSAVDAAAAMTELAKGGLSVEQAMTAAKGTLQLAAAAQIDAARAAEIQSDALNQFGLAAGEAGRVADILANTANAASGEVVDIANALKFVGPVAKTVGAPIESVATAIGLIATQGIRGEQAGTSLRGMIASLAAPSGPASKALDTLGIKAFDAAGKFVGLRTVTEQLAKAKGRMTEAAFTEAAAVAFGNEGMTTAAALASTGAKAFDDMAVSVQRAGGAADVAAAKTKGLGGAWEGFKSQLETTGIEIFEAIDGPLEKLVRSGATFVDQFGSKVAKGIENAVAAGEVFGPRLADAIKSRARVVGSAIEDVFGPIAKSSVGVLNTALNVGIGLWNDFTQVLANAVSAARPVAQGIAAVARSANEADGPISAVAAGIGLIGDVVGAASGLLAPLGSLIGGIAKGFAALPGPIQSAALALGLVAAFRGPLSSLGETVRDRVTAPFRDLNQTIGLQRALLPDAMRQSGQEVGRLGLALSALEKNVPVVGKMADSFRGAAESARGFVTNQVTAAQLASGISGQFTGLTEVLGNNEARLRGVAGAASGAAAALGTGLRSAASGLVNVLGGPFGAAMALVGVGLSLYASAQEEAAKEAQKHASSVQTLSVALRESNGLINQSVRETKAKDIADNYKEAAAQARQLSISQEDLVSAALKQGDAYDDLKVKLQDIIKANTTYSQGSGATSGQTISRLNDTGLAASKLLGTLKGLAGDTDEARKKNDELARAVNDGRASMLDSTDSGRTLAGAMKTLSSNTADADSRARALKSALDALSGGSISLEASQARVQEVMARLRSEFKLTGDATQDAALKAKGWGKELVNAQGGLNLATENGRKLRDLLQDLATSSAETASKTFDLARAQGDDIPTATAKAQAALQEARDAALAAASGMDIGSESAKILADRAGLIPGNVAMVVSTPGSDQTKIELALVKSLTDRVPPDIPISVKTLSDDAIRKLEELGFKVRKTDNHIEITASTAQAQAALNNYIAVNSNKSITIPVRYTSSGVPIAGRGQLQAELADGGLIKTFAHGGFHRQLKPMKGGLAAIVPPNTWRVVGDRLRDDEAYIPINRSVRSVSLLDETASRMGFALMRRYANGGIAATTTMSPTGNTLPSTGEFKGQLYLDSGELLGTVRGAIRQEMDAEAREVRYRGGRA